MKVDLIRLEDTRSGTAGILRINGEIFCVTLEPPYLDNQKNISCIPEGIYLCERVSSMRYGDTFEVKDVSGRTNILFHAGNIFSHTGGCILLGQFFDKLAMDRAIMNSGETFRKFRAVMADQDAFAFNVRSLVL